MNKVTYILIGLAGLFITSCYEDKGDYDYSNAYPEVLFSLNKSYGVKKEKQPFNYTITPDIQVPEEYKKNLTYEWYGNTSSPNTKGDLVGNTESFTFNLDPEDPKLAYVHYLRLYVTDNLTGAVTMQPTTFEIIKPYTSSWMVLHETDGHAEIGAIEYVGGEMSVTPNAYTLDKGESLTGKPLQLGCRQFSTYESSWKYAAQSQFYLTTTNMEESGLLNPGNNFEMRGKWTDILHPNQREEFFEPGKAPIGGGDPGALMVSKGRVFFNSSSSPVFYLKTSDESTLGEYYISKFAAGPHAGVGFDEIGHRFLALSMQNAQDSWSGKLAYEPEPKNAGPIEKLPTNENNAFNPNSIDSGENIVAMVSGYHYGKSGIAPWQRYTIYAYTIKGGNSYVYVFQGRGFTSPGDPSSVARNEFITPEGINENTPMTSGNSFNNILFYAVGNKVYRLDVVTGKNTLLYQHEEPSAQIVTLKMACEGYSFGDDTDEVGTEEYGVPYNRCLGVAINMPDGTGEVVVLQLGTNGGILEDGAKYPSTQIHRGFGPITDIAFI